MRSSTKLSSAPDTEEVVEIRLLTEKMLVVRIVVVGAFATLPKGQRGP